MARIDPIRNFRYRLEIDNITQAGFSEVHISETTIDMVEYREGTDPPHTRKLSGLTKYGNVSLKWGVTIGGSALDMFKWHAAVSVGLIKENRKKVVVVAQDEAGTDAARFVISDAWPVKYNISDLKATGNEVLIEVLELANEGWERTA
jgi:phage tail-like protein